MAIRIYCGVAYVLPWSLFVKVDCYIPKCDAIKILMRLVSRYHIKTIDIIKSMVVFAFQLFLKFDFFFLPNFYQIKTFSHSFVYLLECFDISTFTCNMR